MRPPLPRCALAALALALAACATNPVTGRRELILMSPEREAALGAQAAAQVAEQIGIVDEPELAAYVDALGQRLAARSPRTDVAYRFAVADMPEPNAFALPGGWIYVSRGLLAIANSEAELANVIGHEIGHVAARHSAQRETRSVGVGLLSAIGAIAAGAAGGADAAQAAWQLGQVAGAGLIASYGRDQERQADRVGQELAAGTGWDPAGMPAFLDTLGRHATLATGTERMPTFLDSHPLTGERVETTRRRAAELAVAGAPPIAAARADFLARVDGLRVGPDPGEGAFEDALFRHPGLGFALRFPAGWKTANARSAVGAQAPSDDAVLVLETQGPSGDPEAAAADFARTNGVRLQGGERLAIGGWAAYRARAAARTRQGDLGLDLTWVAHPAATFRLAGLAKIDRFDAHAASFERSGRSLRPLAADERARITDRRLRVVRARSGETLAALSRRTGNAWSVAETAVANALDADAPLASGTSVKIAVDVPYAGPDA